MTIIAKTRKGQEYLYSAISAHKVSKASAAYICKICNECKYRLKEGETWHIYDVDPYSYAHDVAETQHGRVYRGTVKMYSPIMNAGPV